MRVQAPTPPTPRTCARIGCTSRSDEGTANVPAAGTGARCDRRGRGVGRPRAVQAAVRSGRQAWAPWPQHSAPGLTPRRLGKSLPPRGTLLLPLWGFAWRCPWRRGRLRLGHWHRRRLGWFARTRRVTRVWHGDRDLALPRRARLHLEGRQPSLDEHPDHLTLRQGQPRELPPSAILLAAGQGLRGRREPSEMESAAGTFSRGYARGTRKGAPAYRER